MARARYRGEAFVLQIDAHTHFVQGWDDDLIEQWRATKNEYAVITAYPTDVKGSMSADGRLLRTSRPVMCESNFRAGTTRVLEHGAQPEAEPVLKERPMLQP